MFAGYLVFAVLSQFALVGLFLASRWTVGFDYRGELSGIINFRQVDGRLWAGSQPEEDEYRELARRGVELVIDLRSGASDDDRADDPRLLRELGVRYRSIPMRDGRAPTAREVAEFLQAVRRARGVVYVHCGAGVGRSTALQAAYEASLGRDPTLRRLVAIGPLTLAQLWFVANAEPGDVDDVPWTVRRASELIDAPRRALSRLRGAL